MAADNNLDSAARDNISEIIGSVMPYDLEVIVQFDRRSPFAWEDNSSNQFATRRVRLQQGVMETLAILPETDTGDPAILIDFFKWGYETYPADQFFTIIWGHGDGCKNLATETPLMNAPAANKWLAKDRSCADALSSSEINQVFTSLPFAPEIIGFDACLMSCLEVLFELKKASPYILCSQAIEPADGWAYKNLMNTLQNAELLKSPLALGTAIVDEYFQNYTGSKPVTLSLIATAGLPRLLTTLNELGDILTNAGADTMPLIIKARTLVQHFEDPDFIDLYHFVSIIEDRIPELKDKNILKTITNAVAYHQSSQPLYADAFGISVFFPTTEESLANILVNNTDFYAALPAWFNFLKQFTTQSILLTNP
jgi:hypothetical protein